ncbi:hypothetical protein HYT55_05235 [Candidatus Woesearchaeota archaeon]|nr:hypothetical protein [Candidatus Woesearchaeota archaeon]
MRTKRPFIVSPLERHLRHAVACFSETKSIAALFSSLSEEKADLVTGQIINKLSGECVTYSDRLKEYLETKFCIGAKYAYSRLERVHTFLKSTTSDAGLLFIDPTLGQFVNYPHVFVGTETDLRDIFLDSKRRFLAGKRLWAVEHDITSREEWFDLLYRC